MRPSIGRCTLTQQTIEQITQPATTATGRNHVLDDKGKIVGGLMAYVSERYDQFQFAIGEWSFAFNTLNGHQCPGGRFGIFVLLPKQIDLILQGVNRLPREVQGFVRTIGLLSSDLFGVGDGLARQGDLINADDQAQERDGCGNEQPYYRPLLSRLLLGFCGGLLLTIGFKLVGYGVDRINYSLVALAFPLYPIGIGFLSYAFLPWWPFVFP